MTSSKAYECEECGERFGVVYYIRAFQKWVCERCYFDYTKELPSDTDNTPEEDDDE